MAFVKMTRASLINFDFRQLLTKNRPNLTIIVRGLRHKSIIFFYDRQYRALTNYSFWGLITKVSQRDAPFKISKNVISLIVNYNLLSKLAPKKINFRIMCIYTEILVFFLEFPTIFCLPRKIDEKCTFCNFLRGIFFAVFMPRKN